MVKENFSRKSGNNPGNNLALKTGYFLVFFLVILLAVLFYAYSDIFNVKDETEYSEVMPHLLTRIENPEVESRLDNTITEVPSDIFIRTKLNDGVFLAVKEDLKGIYAYDINDQSLKKLIKVKNDHNFINSLSIASNSEWVVWVEDEDLIMDT